MAVVILVVDVAEGVVVVLGVAVVLLWIYRAGWFRCGLYRGDLNVAFTFSVFGDGSRHGMNTLTSHGTSPTATKD